MHVCYLCNEYPPSRHGGVGSFTQTLASELVRRGHQATAIGVYPSHEAAECWQEGVRVIRLAQGVIPGLRIAANYRRLMKRLRQLHRTHPIDVMEGGERSFFLVDSRFPVRKIIRMHGGYTYFKVTLGQRPERFLTWQEKRSFHVANHVCAVSRFVAETTRSLLALGSIEIPVIMNPVDLAAFRPAPGDSEQNGLIVFVGTVVEKKGIRQLVEAMPQIVAGYPAARLVAYGNDTLYGGAGGSFSEFLRRSVAAEIRDRVEFAGPVPRERLPELMAQASVCVYPSHMEALPIAWVEGLAMGKAVVVSQTGPGPEVVEPEVSGLLCNPHIPGSIAAAVLRVLTDRDLRERLGKAARRRAEALFDLGPLVERNLDYYGQCIRAGARHG